MDKNPVYFSIKFIENSLLFEYQLSIDIGGFLDVNYNRRILSEVLNVNDKLIFSRSSNLEFGYLKVIKDHMVNEF